MTISPPQRARKQLPVAGREEKAKSFRRSAFRAPRSASAAAYPQTQTKPIGDLRQHEPTPYGHHRPFQKRRPVPYHVPP
jgi:hypothetical protein